MCTASSSRTPRRDGQVPNRNHAVGSPSYYCILLFPFRWLALLLYMCAWVAMGRLRLSQADPIRPDFSLCGVQEGYLNYAKARVQCCTLPELLTNPTGPRQFIDWKQYLLENPPPTQPRMRMRRAAHLPAVALNRTYLEQLNRAFHLMRSLPHDDPRSLLQQNNLHCLYGGRMWSELGYPHLQYTVHTNWLFLPFHRWATFFFERILAKLVDDEDFTLPFWNWDNQSPLLHSLLPNVLPHFFRNPQDYPPLFLAHRHPRHQPGQPDVMVDLLMNPHWDPDRVSPDDENELRSENNAYLHQYIVENTANGDPFSFMSNPVRLGQGYGDPSYTSETFEAPGYTETFEARIHGSVHLWLGNDSMEYEDSGQPYSAVLDPTFFVHHANVDRMWSVWKGMGRQNYDDPDFLNAEFFFYNEHAQLVRVTVADCLDLHKFMYTFQEVENPWITGYDPRSYKPPPVVSSSSHVTSTNLPGQNGLLHLHTTGEPSTQEFQ